MSSLVSISNEEFLLLGDLIRKECGIHLEEDKKYLIESRLASLVVENQCNTFSEFYIKAKSGLGSQLKEKIVDAMTTNETLWFRDEGPFTILKDYLLPQYTQEILNGSRDSIKIWSAACSTGQEPYSIAICINEFAKANNLPTLCNGKVKITASDISPTALMLAKNGRYNSLAMSRGMSPEMQAQYFEAQGPFWTVKDTVKQMIDFKQFNLQSSFSPLGNFDIVFLRNVAIYFSSDFKKEVFSKIANSLNPGGYLFLGSSESLIGYCNDFQLVEEQRSMVYKLKSKLKEPV